MRQITIARHAVDMVVRSHPFRVGYHYGSVTDEDARLAGRVSTNADLAVWHARIAMMSASAAAFSYASGRMALFSILRAAGIGPGDEVVIPAYTCVVVPNAILFVGATPVYAEIDANSYNIDPDDVERKITPRTRAVIAQHTFGIPADLDALVDLCQRRGIMLIEDAAHAIGATWRGKPVGSIGDAGFFSTDGTKMISTGIGGIAVSRRSDFAAKLVIEWENTAEMPDAISGRVARQFRIMYRATRRSVYWNIGRIGLAWQLRHGWFAMRDEIDSSFPEQYPYPAKFLRSMLHVGLRQLDDLQQNVAHRRRAVERLSAIFAGEQQAHVPAWVSPSWLRFPLQVANPDSWRSVFRKYVEVGDWFNSPVYGRWSDFGRVRYERGSCPIAEGVQRRTVNFPTHYGVTDDVLDVVENLYVRNRDKLGKEMIG